MNIFTIGSSGSTKVDWYTKKRNLTFMGIVQSMKVIQNFMFSSRICFITVRQTLNSVPPELLEKTHIDYGRVTNPVCLFWGFGKWSFTRAQIRQKLLGGMSFRIKRILILQTRMKQKYLFRDWDVLRKWISFHKERWENDWSWKVQSPQGVVVMTKQEKVAQVIVQRTCCINTTTT